MGRKRGYFYFDGKFGFKVLFYFCFNMFFWLNSVFMMLDDNMLGIIKMFDVLIKLDKFV